jgi:hypothetical protein
VRRCAAILLALPLLAGCGESRTHTPAEVQRAFARYGVELVAPRGAPAGYDVLGIASPERRWWYRLETLASTHVGTTPLFARGNGVAVGVYDTPQALPRPRVLAVLRAHAHVAVVGNVLVIWSGPGVLVRAALAYLRR